MLYGRSDSRGGGGGCEGGEAIGGQIAGIPVFAFVLMRGRMREKERERGGGLVVG